MCAAFDTVWNKDYIQAEVVYLVHTKVVQQAVELHIECVEEAHDCAGRHGAAHRREACSQDMTGTYMSWDMQASLMGTLFNISYTVPHCDTCK